MNDDHRKLLIVDDDVTFARVLARALSSRGFHVEVTHDGHAAVAQARSLQPRYCVLDLKLGEQNGLQLIAQLRRQVPGLRILLLTGYASIATAVEAIKRGAHDYLAKPVDADAVVRALTDDHENESEQAAPETPGGPLPLRRLEWEHIQRVLNECDGNISETARRLGMHRRTLQRKLAKHPVSERPREHDE
jgi:two-component system response regulator RegA